MRGRASVLMLGCLLPVLTVATPLISVQQRTALAALCSNGGDPLNSWSSSLLRTGLLITSPQGDIEPLHDQLPAALRAENLDSTGLVLCTEVADVVLETCNINLFFSNLPRIRRDYRLQLRSVYSLREVGRTLLTGPTPPTCSDPSTLKNGQTRLGGVPPSINDVLAWLASVGADTGDSDADGFSNLREQIIGTSSADPNSPAPVVDITYNGAASRQVVSGEPLTLQLHFLPGPYTGQLADYYVWAQANGATYAYGYPQGFKPANGAQLSVRAPAVPLSSFPLTTFTGLPAGEYQLNFMVRFNDQTSSSISTPLRVQAPTWQFVNVTQSAGFNHLHGFSQIAGGLARDRQFMIAGVAAGDYDKDGWIDLYLTRGSGGANLLYRNRGDGRFEDTAVSAGVAISGEENSGATFADYDGDGWLDLLVSGINLNEQPHLFRNQHNGTFSETTAQAGLPLVSQNMGSSFGDYDKDGDLDLWLTHWNADTQHSYLFRNNLVGTGSSSFSDISTAAGIADDVMNDYTANFADIDNDSWPDILVAADFGTSQIFTNQQNGTLKRTRPAVLSDENGMGAAVGDYDNDGDLDWFVSSIYDDRPASLNLSKELLGITWGLTGNRFYRNRGDGSFEDVTTATDTRNGGWGWGACFADFDNDGWLDLFHVNGYDSSVLAATTPFPFRTDASRLYINDQHGSFRERAVELGINDNAQGRGISCFDYDRDGDIDIFVANNAQAPLLYENRGLQRHWLEVRVGGEQLNSEAIGARVYLTAGGQTQMREISAGSNFMSQNPTLLHFGLGNATRIDSVHIVWPSGFTRTLTGVAADQLLEIMQ